MCDSHSNDLGDSHSSNPSSGGSPEEVCSEVLDDAVIKAVFPDRGQRNKALGDIGKKELLSQIKKHVPIDDLKDEMATSGEELEKPNLSIGFIPITCATPIIMAEPMGFYRRHGLQVKLKKAEGWEQVRDWAMEGSVDAAHMLCTMPLAISLGCEHSSETFLMPAVEDNNGSAFTLHRRLSNIEHPSQLKGMTIAIPYRYSMHNYLLRYYLSDYGLDPDRDLNIVEISPPKMLAALKRGEVDGYFAPEPFNQLAVAEEVGFIYLLSKEIWDGHPCCGFSVSEDFTQRNPNTFKALFKTIVDASLFSSSINNRRHIAKVIAGEQYLDQPVEILEQVLMGEFPDGRGRWRKEPQRIDFDPYPWQSMAVWIMTQMKRWGHVSEDFNYRDVAEKVYLAEQCDEEIRCLGYKKRGHGYRRHFIMNSQFDPYKAEQYSQRFPKRSSEPSEEK